MNKTYRFDIITQKSICVYVVHWKPKKKQSKVFRCWLWSFNLSDFCQWIYNHSLLFLFELQEQRKIRCDRSTLQSWRIVCRLGSLLTNVNSLGPANTLYQWIVKVRGLLTRCSTVLATAIPYNIIHSIPFLMSSQSTPNISGKLPAFSATNARCFLGELRSQGSEFFDFVKGKSESGLDQGS